MKIFITTTFKESKNKKEISHLCNIIRCSGFDDFCFVRNVENYKKIFSNPKLLMQRAEEEIINCNALLFDATEKSTGRAIELGIAFANKKKIIIIMKEGTEIKDTLRGVADIIITYNKIEDIQINLSNFVKRLQKYNN